MLQQLCVSSSHIRGVLLNAGNLGNTAPQIIQDEHVVWVINWKVESLHYQASKR